MRLSLKESRMKLLNATNLDRKSGIRGPKKMGEAQRSLYARKLKAFEKNHIRPTYAGANVGHPYGVVAPATVRGEACGTHPAIDTGIEQKARSTRPTRDMNVRALACTICYS